MVKIIHCADIHIGSVLQNLSSDKAKIRKREIIDTFLNLMNYANKNKVNVVIIAGDLFDKNTIAKSTKKEILDTIANYTAIDFLYLTGNHDDKIKFDDEDLELPPNLKLFNSKDDWIYFDYGDVCITGFDVHKSKGTGFYEKLKLDKNKFNIATMHGDLKTIQLDRLKGKYIDYLALGDIHIPCTEPKKLDIRGLYGYCGCLEGRGNDESGERGFFLIEISQGKMKREFIKIAKRKHEIVEIDITGLDNHTKIASAMSIATQSIKKENIVRVILKGKYNADTQKDKENLTRKLQETFFCGNIKDLSKLDMSSVDYENEISLRREFVELVKQSNLPDDEKDKIIEYGIKALQGEVIEI